MFGKIAIKIGIWGYLAFAVLGLLFVSGYAFEDLPLAEVIANTAAWVLPMALGLWLVHSRYRHLKSLMIGLAAVVALISVGMTAFPRQWLSFRFTEGPVVVVAVLALAVVLAWWARHEPRIAGLLMLFIGLVPLIAESIAQGFVAWGGSSVAGLVPVTIAGALILLGSQLQQRS